MVWSRGRLADMSIGPDADCTRILLVVGALLITALAVVAISPPASAADPQPQTITFDALPDATYGDAPITLTATASSGLPVSYGVGAWLLAASEFQRAAGPEGRAVGRR